MSNLIERALRHMNDPHARYSMKDRFDHAQLFANEIERLNREVEEVHVNNIALAKENREQDAEIERLRGENKAVHENRNKVLEINAKLQAVVDAAWVVSTTWCYEVISSTIKGDCVVGVADMQKLMDALAALDTVDGDRQTENQK